MEQTLRTFEEHFETSWWQTLNVFSWMLTSRSRMTCLSDTNQTMLTRLKSSSQVWTDMQSMENYFLLDHMIGLSREKRPVILMLSIRLAVRSEEHTSELQSLMRISYAVFCLKKKKNINTITTEEPNDDITYRQSRKTTTTQTCNILK